MFFADSTSDFKVPVVYVSMSLANEIKKLDQPKATLLVKINRTRPAAYNVAGFLNKGAVKTIIVGAHYDHVGTPR